MSQHTEAHVIPPHEVAMLKEAREDRDEIKHLRAAVKDMLDWAEYETEYDGTTMTMCASCGRNDPYEDHRPGCKVAEYTALVASK